MFAGNISDRRLAHSEVIVLRALDGTFDQGGNVWEWTEAVIRSFYRASHGGAWHFSSDELGSGIVAFNPPTEETFNRGFRVAAAIPEPTTLALAAIGPDGRGVLQDEGKANRLAARRM